MKKPALYILLISLFCLYSCDKKETSASVALNDLYSELDEEIDRSREYEQTKEMRISRLKNEYERTSDENRKTLLLEEIAGEFNAYNADSALHYLGLNLKREAVRQDPKTQIRLKIRRADVFAHAGLFADALEILRTIPRDSLDRALSEEYFATYCATYQYLSEYTNEHEITGTYEKLREQYTDSLNRVIDDGSFNHKVYVVSEMGRQGENQKAIELLTKELGRYKSGTREYSILASTLSYIHHEAGNYEDYKRYLVLSAISDVRGAVKENMSFRGVATFMFEEGDVDRANRYLKKSIADANFYSAHMRNAQSSKMLPVIDEAYTSQQNKLNGRLRGMAWFSSILSVILILTILLLLKQFRRLHEANQRVRKTNGELSDMSRRLKEANEEMKLKNGELEEMSARLREANSELALQNIELQEYNKTKEQYAGLFMEYCSSAISTLQHYQQSLRVLAAKSSSRDALIKKLESSEAADQLLKNFYARFDDAILTIYPEFVERVNDLLRPGEKITLKKGELQNTELRLLALIRIGIDDSAKIAEFLRCSLSTIYTYRSKMKKRAIDPSGFEDAVKKILGN